MVNDPEFLMVYVEQHRQELRQAMHRGGPWGRRVAGALHALLNRRRNSILNHPFTSRSMPRA